MNDQLPWSLQFNNTVHRKESAQALDLYVLRSASTRQNPIIIAVPTGDKESPRQVEVAMNGLGKVELRPDQDWSVAFKRIFHGPWIYHEETKRRYIRITAEEEYEIRGLILKESAGRVIAELNAEQLRKDKILLEARLRSTEQALLKANAARLNSAEQTKVEIPDHDFFRDAIVNHPDLFPDPPMSHHSQFLCQRGGCSE